jgi:hypothetical protein
MPETLVTQEADSRRITVGSQPGQIVHETLSQKYSTRKKSGRVAQVVEYLSSKHESVSSYHSTAPPPKKNPALIKFL